LGIRHKPVHEDGLEYLVIQVNVEGLLVQVGMVVQAAALITFV